MRSITATRNNHSPEPYVREVFRVESERLPIWREMLAGFDWLALRTSAVYQGEGVQAGNGTPVVVVPGLFGTDSYLGELRNWLTRIGYRAHRSEVGRNVECPLVMVERLIQTAEKIHSEHGMRVSLVGHSLGGLIARGAAIRRPDLIGEAITVGSPINGVRAHPAILAAARRIGADCTDECLAWTQEPLPAGVSEASIYSRSDGVVGWRSCLPIGSAPSIEVRSTHNGLVVNRESYAALAVLLHEAIGRRRDAITRGTLRLVKGRQSEVSTSNQWIPAIAG